MSAQAQVIPLYPFTTATSPYQALTGATTFSPTAGGGTDDDGYSAPQTIPFAFRFGFNSYTSYVVNTNGWITFGPGATTPYASPLNGSVNQMIGYFAKDLRSDGPNTTYSSVTTGTSPNRIHKIQAAEFTQYGNETATGNVQLWLYESGKIEMHYGTFSTDWTPGSTNGVQVGLRGNSLTDVRSLSGSWGAPVAGTNSADVLPHNGAADNPISGQVFIFNLPAGDLTPPAIGTVNITPLGGTCLPSAHTVTASPTDASGLSLVELVYTVSGTTTPVVLTMTRSGSTYSATIPAQGSNGVTYFVRATDNGNNRLVTNSPPQTYRDASLTINAGADQTHYIGETATLTASTSLGGTVRITEFTMYAGGTGATNPYPSFIAPGTEDFVEITNMGSGQVDLSSYGFEVQGGSAARTYSFPAGTVVPARSVLVLHIGDGTDDPANLYYHTGGLNDQLTSGNDQAFILSSPSGQVVDAVVANAFPVTPPVTGSDWSGTGASSPRNIAGAGLYGADVNSATNWSDAQAVPQSIGTINVNLPTLTASAVQWTGPNLTGTVTANPLITPTFTTAGTFTYTASITNGACTITDQVRVTVLAPSPPRAAFIADRTSISINDFVHLIDQATNRPLAWRYRIFPTSGWQYIANTTPTSQSPYVQFTQGGVYTVRQTVSNGAGRDSLTRTNYITVNSAPRYCADVNISPCTTGYIDAVSILGTTLRNRGTGCTSGPSGTGYTNFPALDSTTATLRAGLTFSITVKPSAAGAVVAWMDYNSNGVYDSAEFIPIAPRPNVAGQPRTFQFTIPVTAVPGEVGLRVRSRRNAGILYNDPCTVFFDGETEDYTLTLLPGCTLATPTVTSNGPLCAGSTLTLNATNLTTGATLAWSGPNGFSSSVAAPQIPNATAAASGTYTLTVSKAGCSTSGSVSVIVNTPPTAPTLATNSPVCAGQLLTLSATNISAGATIAWTGPNNFTSASATPQITAATAAAAGTYTATVTRAGCSVTRTVTVAVSAAPSAPTVTGASRCGTGTITLTAAGAPAGSTYNWYTTSTGGTPIAGVTTATYAPSVSATTTYYVAITSGGSCEGPRTPVTATVTTAPNPTLTASGSTSACQGGGVLLTAANGGTGANYSFYRNNQLIVGTSGSTYTATQSGTYTVSASVGTCSGVGTASVVVTITPAPAAPTAPTVTRCGTGTVTLAATGAPTGGGYRWYATSSSTTVLASTATYLTPSISGVTTYYVSTVTADGCESARTSVTAIANNNPTPTLAAGGPTTFCAGGAVTLTASGGATGATYQFLLNGQPITGATGTTYSATQAGTYTVTANNGSSCTATSTASVGVTVNPAASAAFAYASSTYCLSGANPTPAITGTAGGAFSVTPATGLSLNPTTGAVNLSASQPGTYTVTYAVGGQCPASQTQTLTLSTAPAAAFTYPTTSSRCVGTGSLTPALGTGASAGTFTATPAGLTLNASNGSIDLSTSQPGTYTVTNTIAASGSCAAASATASLTLLAAPTASVLASGPTTFCDGGSVTLTASGGTSYLWSTGATSPSITVTTAGTYTVTATNAASCSATSAPTTVTVNPTLSAAFTYAASTFCLGGTNPLPTVTGAPNGTFTGSAGLAINNATGAIDLTASAAGTYTVTYSTGLGSPCPASATQTVTLTSAPSAAFSYSTATPACAGATATLTPTLAVGSASGTFSATPAGLTINPTTGEVNLATSLAGTYTVTNAVASSGSCPASSANSTLTVGALPVATIIASGPLSFCEGDSVRLTVGGTGTILWSNGASTPSITVSQSGTYSVTVTNATGCEATSAPTIVTATPRATAAFSFDAATYCLSAAAPVVSVTGTAGGTFSATPAGLSINSTTGAINLSASTAGTYTVTYAVSGTCGASQTQTLTLTAPAVAAFSYANAGCAGSTGSLAVTLGAGATAGTFSTPFSGLGLNPTTGAIDLSTSQPGTYDVINTLPASGGCAAVSDTAQVTINAQPVAAFVGLSANYCAGDGAVTLTGTIDGVPVTSTTGSFTIDGTAATQFTPSTLSPGAHTVVLTGSNGTCSGSVSFVVTVTATPATPTITQAASGGFVVLTSSATSGNLWYLNGTPIPGAIGTTYTVTAAAQSGTYTVVSTTNGCGSTSSAPVTVTVTGIAHAQALALPVSLFPNPTLDGLVTVELAISESPTPLTVFDVTGRSVFTTVLPANETRTALDLRHLPTGVYLVRLQTAGGSVIKRLVRD
jgi:Ig-like domain CHU_C associated/Lamin Tail Domain/GEVED domain/Secretion system C-terminal sorting domain